MHSMINFFVRTPFIRFVVKISNVSMFFAFAYTHMHMLRYVENLLNSLAPYIKNSSLSSNNF